MPTTQFQMNYKTYFFKEIKSLSVNSEEIKDTVKSHENIDDAIKQWVENNSMLPEKLGGYSWVELIEGKSFGIRTRAQFVENRGFEAFGDWEHFLFEPMANEAETFPDKLQRLIKAKD